MTMAESTLPAVKDIFNRAQEVLGYDIQKVRYAWDLLPHMSYIF